MAFLPWQQVSAPNNSTAASFMKLAMQGVENAGKSFSDAAQGASDIYKNKADAAREKANALLTGQVLNAPDSEAASMLMQDALAASGDSGLFNTKSLTNAQDALKTRIDTETAEVDLKYKQDTLDNRVTLKEQEVRKGSQEIEKTENSLANTVVTDVVNAMESPIRNFYLNTGALPSTEEMETMLNEYFTSNNIDPNSERGRLIQTKFASEAQKKAMSVALQVDGLLTKEQASAEAENIAAGRPNLGSTAVVDQINNTGSLDQVAKNAIANMGKVSESGDGETNWDKKTTGASSPQEWESKILMLAGEHDVPAGQLHMALSMGFRDVSDERGFLTAVAAAQQQYVRNKEHETKQNEVNKKLTEVSQLIQKKELSFKMLMQQDGNLSPKQVAEKQKEIDTLKEEMTKHEQTLQESHLGKWVDPYKVEVALEELNARGSVLKPRLTPNRGKQEAFIPNPLSHTPDKDRQIFDTEARMDYLNGHSMFSPSPSTDSTKEDVSKFIKGLDTVSDVKNLEKWKEGKIAPKDVEGFKTQLSDSPELKEEFTNWYNNNIVQASEGNEDSFDVITAPNNTVVKSFMKHHAVVSEANDAAREAELAELNTDKIANELIQKSLAGQGMTPVDPNQLAGSGRTNASNTKASKKGPNKEGIYISDWTNPNRNPDPAGSTTIKVPPGAGFLLPSVWPVVDDYVQENFGRSLTSPEWQSIQYELARSEGNEKMFNNTTSREIVIPNELLERLFSGQN